jgi:hypothetical protein
MHIISIFSGRQSNIEILKKYLQKALELNIIDEVHFWNYTRKSQDEDYLKTISNLKRTSSKINSNYLLINPIISNNSFELNVKASNDIHIKLIILDKEYEIVLGCLDNTKSVIRENNTEIFNLIQNNVVDKNNYNNFKINIDNGIMNIVKNNKLLISHNIKNDDNDDNEFEIKDVYIKTGNNSVGNFKYNVNKNNGFYFMDVCEKKQWANYYHYYDDKEFENDIIIKCDDDIVFIDLYKLPNFIDFIKKSDYDLVFANIINNGVSAYYQQNKYKLIPKDLMVLEYPHKGGGGSLWQSGKKAEDLHNYFIKNYTLFLDNEYNNEIIPINDRFSINFFGYKGNQFHKIKNAGDDHCDEYSLTVKYVEKNRFKNILYSDFYVSHLSFYQQNRTGINLNNLIDSYNKLYYTVEETGRFK